MRRLMTTAMALAALFGTSAMASSPDAWAAYETEVRDACFKAGGLAKPDAESKVIVFGDDIGRDAMIIDGDDTQRGTNDDKLCLFDKKSRTAVVSDIPDDD